ncbi:MAG: hypothetical protein FWH53_09905 [Leptospirales bacterium]|nr:hypothetical protein [Leptospirales bacterium]
MIYLIICFLLTGCSYEMDMVERAITDRASFSIDADYNKYSNTLTISWSVIPSEEGFGGYEVYIIPEAWNEFGTYEVIAARHTLSSKCQSIYSLGTRTIRSVNITVDPSNLDGEGEYYVRLGIVKMAVKDSDADPKIYYIGSDSDDYNKHSSVDKISGYKAVYID